LITGGCGFIGSHLVEALHRVTKWDIVIIDKLGEGSYGLERIRDACLLDSRRIRVFTCDLAAAPFTSGLVKELGRVEMIVHLAAESHVDRSISDPVECVKNNIMATMHLLEYCRRCPSLGVVVGFSTDEVHGVAPPGVAYKETDRHLPGNPYSSSKSSSEQLFLAFANTYNVPVILTRMVNAMGQRQEPLKFVPLCIRQVRDGEKILIHADKTGLIPGSRFYIHARNVADAVVFILHNGEIGETYNIATGDEVDNLDMAQRIADIMGMTFDYELVNFHENRPGHDQRYSLDGSKLRELGWTPSEDFNLALRKTVEWTLANPRWLEPMDETHL